MVRFLRGRLARIADRPDEPTPLGKRAAAALAVAAVAGLAAVFGWFERIDLLVYDGLLVRNGRAPSEKVAIVAVDERSLAALGQWAWPRSVHAALVRRLDEAGARIIAFDVVFADRDAHDAANDAAFARAMKAHGGVVLPILHQHLPPNGQLVELLPAAPLAEAAAALAHVEVEEDVDGVVRRCFLKAGVATAHWPSLSLAAVQLETPDVLSRIPVVSRRDGDRQVRPMAWVRDALTLIPYAGPPGHFPRVSYIDVLNGDFDANLVRGRIVFVGATATALQDAVKVPFGPRRRSMTGVELQANVADALLQGVALRPASPAWLAAFSAAAPLLHWLLSSLVGAGWLAFGPVVAIVFVATVTAMAAGLWVPPAAAIAGVGVHSAVQVSARRRAARRTLVREQERAAAGLKSIADGVIATDAAGTIVFMNPAAEQLTGFLFSEAGGRPLWTILRLQDALAGTPLDLDLVIENGVTPGDDTVEAVLRTRDGHVRSVRGTIAGVGGGDGQGGGLVLALNDVTDVHNLARSIEYQATHDPLTSLPNRKLFEQTVEHALAASAVEGKYITIILVEVDHIGAIVEALGQQAANAVLRMASARLAGCVREPGMAARVSEHRFALLFLGLMHGDAATFLAQRVRRTLAEPFDVAGFEQTVGACIGAATYPRHAADARSLIVAAERALAGAKQHRGNRIQQASDALHPVASRRAGIRRTLRQAIDHDEMALHFQPQVALGDGGVTGVEALLRWSDTDGRLNPPEDVVAAAKELGLADDLSGWVLRTACREAASAAGAAGTHGLRVSVNVTADQFLNPRLPAAIGAVLAQPEARGVSLVLEITEETLIADMDTSRKIIERIRNMDVDVFIDDFGVGYASLLYLKKLPLSGLKIDKSYVHDALLEANGAAIVRAIIALAHSMRIRVIAEGVETKEQLAFLRSETCDEVQGYLIGRPLPTQRLTSWLQKESGAARRRLTG